VVLRELLAQTQSQGREEMNREDIDIMWSKALQQAIKDGEAFTRYHFAALVRADEREACAKKTEEFARKWWKIHCDSNLHYSSTLKAHQDFCALQAAIRARGQA
jgi:hypothetical protein